MGIIIFIPPAKAGGNSIGNSEGHCNELIGQFPIFANEKMNRIG